MSYPFFGCGSIGTRIGYISCFNMLWITLVIMINFKFRLSNYDVLQFNDYEIIMENDTSQTLSDQREPNGTVQLLNHNSTTYSDLDGLDWSNGLEPLMKMFMDYVLIVKTAWYLMEFYLNANLIQSSYPVSPQEIYAWLVIYYFKLGAATIFQCMTIVKFWFLTNYWNLFYIIIVGVELYFVQSYYNQQKLAAVDNFVALKWKYLPKPKTKFEKSANVETITIKTCDLTEDDGYIPIFVKKT